MTDEVILHCWAGKADQYEIGADEWAEAMAHPATCLLPDGHDGPHDWTPDEEIIIEFPPKEEE